MFSTAPEPRLLSELTCVARNAGRHLQGRRALHQVVFRQQRASRGMHSLYPLAVTCASTSAWMAVLQKHNAPATRWILKNCAHSYSSPQSGLRPDTLEFCCDIPLSELLLLCILLNLQASGTATMLQSSVTYQAASSSLAESAACLVSMGPSALV